MDKTECSVSDGGKHSASENSSSMNNNGASSAKKQKKKLFEETRTQAKIDNFRKAVSQIVSLSKKFLKDDNAEDDLSKIRKTLRAEVPFLNASSFTVAEKLKKIPTNRQYKSPKQKKASPTLDKQSQNPNLNDLITMDAIIAFEKACQDIENRVEAIAMEPNPSDKDVERLKALSSAFVYLCPQLDAALDAITKKLESYVLNLSNF